MTISEEKVLELAAEAGIRCFRFNNVSPKSLLRFALLLQQASQPVEQPTSECSKCGRWGFDDEIGSSCAMLQSDNTRCDGVFIVKSGEQPTSTAELPSKYPVSLEPGQCCENENRPNFGACKSCGSPAIKGKSK